MLAAMATDPALIDAPLSTVEITTGPQPEASVLWLHGLGADGHDFEPIVPELDLPLAVRFVFPHAPVRPVTINGGLAMRAWYDFRTLDFGRGEAREDIDASRQAVTDLLRREESRGIPAGRIVVAGFSQGGVIALYAALCFPRRLAGLVTLSSYLPLAEQLDRARDSAQAGLPVFLAHGEADPIIPLAQGQAAARWLIARDYAVQAHSYAMAHGVCSQEIRDLRDWLLGVLAPGHG